MRLRLAVLLALVCSATLTAQRGVAWDYDFSTPAPQAWFEVWVNGAYRSGVIAADRREWTFPAGGLGQGTHQVMLRVCTALGCTPASLTVTCGVSECRGEPASIVAPRAAGIGAFRSGVTVPTPPTPTAITYVRSASGQDYGGGASTTISTSTPIQLTAGDTNIVEVRHVDPSGSAVVTGAVDAAGNTYQPVPAGSYRIAAGERLTVVYASNAKGHPANVVTATFSTAVQYRGIVTVEYAGLAVDAVPVAVATGSTSGQTLTSTPFSAGPHALVFVSATVATLLPTWTPGTGYAFRGQDDLRVTAAFDRRVLTTETGIVATVTSSDSSRPKGMLVTTFKGAAP